MRPATAPQSVRATTLRCRCCLSLRDGKPNPTSGRYVALSAREGLRRSWDDGRRLERQGFAHRMQRKPPVASTARAQLSTILDISAAPFDSDATSRANYSRNYGYAGLARH